jgi:glutathione-regulated potassium-efflux system ancillary protein KefG
MTSPSVLIIFAHPAIHKSRVNRALIENVRDMEYVRVQDLYSLYPDFYIDVEVEQKLLSSVELIVLHHPMFWYSCPSLLKEWEDVVLEKGYAYGPGGDALRGKRLLSVISTGGKAEAYQPDGYNKFTVQELLRPFEATANLCGMTYHRPHLIQSSYSVTDEDIERHAIAYREILKNYLESGDAYLAKRDSERAHP